MSRLLFTITNVYNSPTRQDLLLTYNIFFLKHGVSQITFFRKVRETNIHSKSFLKFDFAHFGI